MATTRDKMTVKEERTILTRPSERSIKFLLDRKSAPLAAAVIKNLSMQEVNMQEPACLTLLQTHIWHFRAITNPPSPSLL